MIKLYLMLLMFLFNFVYASDVVIYDPDDAIVASKVTSYLKSVNTPDYEGDAFTLIDPDLSSVTGVAQKYWKVDVSSNVVEMSSGEKDAVDDDETYDLISKQVKGVVVTTTTTSTDFVDLADMDISGQGRAGKFLITFSGVFSNDTAGESVVIIIDVDGVEKTESTRTVHAAGADGRFVMYTAWMQTLDEGDHTAKIKWKVSGGTGKTHNVHRIMHIEQLN